MARAASRWCSYVMKARCDVFFWKVFWVKIVLVTLPYLPK